MIIPVNDHAVAEHRASKKFSGGVLFLRLKL